MKRLLMFVVCLLLLSATAGGAHAPVKRPMPEVLGIRLGMSQRSAHARLKKLGKLEKEARKFQEVWAIGDRRFSHLIVGFDPEQRVRYVTAIARADGMRMRYDEVGNLKAAEAESGQGNHKFTWEVPARRGQFAYIVVAQGRDTQFLDSFSVKKTGVGEVD